MSRSVFDHRRGAMGARPFIMYDSSPNLRHGIYNTNNVPLKFGLVGPFSSGTNRAIGRAVADGDRHFGYGELSAYSSTFNTTAVTIGAWAWLDPTFPTSGNEIFCSGVFTSGGTVAGYRLSWNRNLDQYGLSWMESRNGPQGQVFAPASASTVGAWHHICGTGDTTGSAIYGDGAVKATAGAVTPSSAATIQSVGNLVSGSYVDQEWLGRLAGVFFCPTALSAGTIAGIASQTTMAAYKAAVLATSPLALWMLDE